MKNPKYNIYFLLDFIQKYMLPLKAEGITWGYDIPYLFTGLLNQHPREAIEFEAKKQTAYSDFYKRLLEND